MKFQSLSFRAAACLAVLAASPTRAEDKSGGRFEAMDIFQLEHASDPQISPDGKQVVYVRNFVDIKKDRRRSHLLIINADGHDHRPVTDGDANEHSPRWSPDGKRLLYLSGRPSDGPARLHCRWMDTTQTAQIGHLPAAPSEMAWAPDGKSIAFVMQVIERPNAAILRRPDSRIPSLAGTQPGGGSSWRIGSKWP